MKELFNISAILTCVQFEAKSIMDDQRAALCVVERVPMHGVCLFKAMLSDATGPALCRGYTDATFAQQIEQPAYLGFLGPVLHVTVGDRVHILFKNNCSFPASVHTHGLAYSKSNEGAVGADGTDKAQHRDDAVPPGETHTYKWTVRTAEQQAPSAGQG